jgi:seryl-tRNA synthetase
MSNVQSAKVKPELANTKSTHASKARNNASHKAITHKVKHPNIDKTELKFKKARKISKSIKRIESEMSDIQSQMTKIGKDLNNVLHLMQEKGTTQISNKKHQS